MDPVLWTVIGLTVAAYPGVAMKAYWAGRRTGSRKTMPWRPIFQLVDHRTHCLGHAPARVQAELGPLLSLSSLAWGELLAMRRPVKVAAFRPRAVANWS
jgi:hypothetical protein